MSQSDELRKQCQEEAFDCFGTAEIFGKRSKTYRRKLRGLTFLGVVVPAAVGGLVLSFGVDFQYTSVVIGIASVLGLAELVLSLWSLVAKWDDLFAYSLESLSANTQLYSMFKELAENPPQTFQEFKTQYELLQAQNRARTDRDSQQIISERENRFGMRASLRQFQKACASCKKVPTSLKPTDCDVCGDF